MKFNITIKKTWAVLMAFCLLTSWVGCKKDSKSLEPTLMLAHDLLEVSGRSSEQFVEFLSSSPWTLTTDVDWISLTSTEGIRKTQNKAGGWRE